MQLGNTGGLTRVALLVAISEASQEVLFEKWDYGNNTAECVQQATVDYRNERAPDGLITIPFRCFGTKSLNFQISHRSWEFRFQHMTWRVLCVKEAE